MNSFGELLKQYIKEQGLTIYQLAKDSGMDRTFLQSVLSGKKKMPEKRLNDIVNTRSFDSKQVHNLVKSYYIEKYGKDKIEKFVLIEKGIKGEYIQQLNKKIPVTVCDIISNCSYTGKNNILSLIFTILNLEDSNIYTNFSFSRQSEINNIVYNCLKNNRIPSFFHFVCPNSINGKDKIVTFFHAHHYAEIGYQTYYCNNALYSNAILPYFIITDNYFLQFDEASENAILLDKSIVKPIYDNKIEEIKKSCYEAVMITENAMDIMELFQTETVNQRHENVYGFDGTFCPTFIDKEIVERISTPVSKRIPNIAKQLISHYKMMIGETDANKINLILTYNSLKDFISTGRIYDFPKTLADNVPIDMRAKMIKPLLDEKRFTFNITNPHTFKNNYYFNYQINDNIMLAISCDSSKIDETFIGEVSSMSNDKELCNDFIDFYKYFMHTEYCYSTEASIALMKSFINKTK